jgi:hypothetical protein
MADPDHVLKAVGNDQVGRRSGGESLPWIQQISAG